jgi:putative ABC transport system permease protein
LKNLIERIKKIEKSPRWVKILNDIWGNKTRSMLVVFSIAVGVGVVGMINNARYLIERDIYTPYSAGNPAEVSLYISPFQEDLAHAVEGMREVKDAQPRQVVSTNLIRPDGKTVTLVLSAVPDYNDISVNIPTPEEGSAIPKLRQVVLERQAADKLNIHVGDTILVELPDDGQYELQVSGINHDIYDFPYLVSSKATGYINQETLQWMGQTIAFNKLDIVVAGSNLERNHVLDVAAKARDRVIQPAGYVVGSIEIPGMDSDPGEFWAQNQIGGFMLILQIMSVAAIFLSGGLVINTITAILTQQVKQIGIMRSVGAVPNQITLLYIVNVLVLSILGLLIAIPLGWLGSGLLAEWAGNFLNFTITKWDLYFPVALLQTVLALIVPVGVALYPIIAGTTISVYQAIYQQGLVQDGQKAWVEKMLSKLAFLSPPTVLSILNTFRNIPRLAFTLVTLTLAGATFVATFSTRSSLNAQVEQIGRYVYYDVAIDVKNGISRYTAEREAKRIPGVVAAEGWVIETGMIKHDDGSEGEEIQVYGIPYDSIMIQPKLIKGRWLTEGDAWQVVVNQDLLQSEDVKVGDQINVEVQGVEREMQIVGITTKTLRGSRAYMNYAMFSKLTGRNDEVSQVRIRTNLKKLALPAKQEEMAKLVEERFSNAGLSDSNAQTNFQVFGYFSEPFKILLTLLMVMAGVLGLVGGLSLAGTMSINVMERTREIGVLRSVGASNETIRKVVVVEGIGIAVLSWLLVVLISGPSSASLASAVIYTVLGTRPTIRFSIFGLILWLVIVAVIGAVSSLTPAQNAVSLTVREVLDYE